MKTNRWLTLTAGAAILVLLAGCGGNNDAGNTSSGNTANSGGSVAAADAEQLYKENCVSCHRADLKGQNLDTVGGRLSKEEIEQKIRKGGGGMIAFEKRLNDAEIEALTVWLEEKK